MVTAYHCGGVRDVTMLVAGVHGQVVDARLCEDVLLKVKKTTHI